MKLQVRAYDAKHKRMVYDIADMVGNTLHHYYLGQDDDYTIAIYREGDGMALPTMLFTGLWDNSKYKRKIFEGDVVTFWTTEEYQNSPPIFVTAEVCYDDEDGGFYYLTDQGNFPYLKPYFATKVCVIGNIHENPEFEKNPEFKIMNLKKGKKS